MAPSEGQRQRAGNDEDGEHGAHEAARQQRVETAKVVTGYVGLGVMKGLRSLLDVDGNRAAAKKEREANRRLKRQDNLVREATDYYRDRNRRR